MGREGLGGEAVGSEGVSSEGMGSEGMGSEGMGSEAMRSEGMGSEGLTSEGLTSEPLKRLSRSFIYTNNIINIRTSPAKVKYIPFLKAVVLGINIQKEEITKNNNEAPKNIFIKNKGLPVVAL